MTSRDSKPSLKSKAVAAGMVTLTSLSVYGAVNAIAATATMPILAKLIRAIEITINTSLDFGTLAMDIDQAGHATIDPAVDRLYVKGASGLTLAGGRPRSGQLQIRGADLPVTVSLEDTVVKLTNGTSTILVDNFNFITMDGGTKATVTPAINDYTVTVALGATINTRVEQITGTYIGTTKIFANYQ